MEVMSTRVFLGALLALLWFSVKIENAYVFQLRSKFARIKNMSLECVPGSGFLTLACSL